VLIKSLNVQVVHLLLNINIILNIIYVIILVLNHLNVQSKISNFLIF
jgi:hypothetical protein